MSGTLVGQVGTGWGQPGGAFDRVGAAARDARAGADGVPGGFGGALDSALGRVEAPATGSREEDEVTMKIRGMAEELVSAAFVRPVLAKMRETNQSAPPFAPGPWEKAFGPQLDTEVAARIVQSSRFPLVDSLTDQLVAKVRGGVRKEAVDG